MSSPEQGEKCLPPHWGGRCQVYLVGVAVTVGDGAIPPGGVAVNGDGGVGDGPWVIVGLGRLVGVTRLARTIICWPAKIVLASVILFSLRISSEVLLNFEAIAAMVSPDSIV